MNDDDVTNRLRSDARHHRPTPNASALETASLSAVLDRARRSSDTMNSEHTIPRLRALSDRLRREGEELIGQADDIDTMITEHAAAEQPATGDQAPTPAAPPASQQSPLTGPLAPLTAPPARPPSPNGDGQQTSKVPATWPN